MTIEEIKKSKQELETEISKKLNEFMKKTDTCIDNVNILTMDFYRATDGKKSTYKVQIELDIRL